MLASLAMMIVLGFAVGSLFEKVHLPKIIGYLLAGMLMGPSGWNLVDDKILNISSELRQIALIMILIKAGLTLNLSELKTVGRPAVLLSFLPASFEIIGYTLFAPMIIGISHLDAMIIGAVLSAVSPAVVVPRMVHLIETKRGTDKSIPQMILAGASCDDIFVIVLFSTFVGIAQGHSFSVWKIFEVPESIALGIVLGIAAGITLNQIFRRSNSSTYQMIVMVGFAFALYAIESCVKSYVSISGLLAVVAMSCTVKYHSEDRAVKLSHMTAEMWSFAEIMLFFLVGCAVDLSSLAEVGVTSVVLILISLMVRSIGVGISLIGTKLNWKEKVFCIISYLPKATVQAAIGSVPLSLGLGCGEMVLGVAVLGILITAPLGAIGIDYSESRLLENNSISS